MNASDNRRLPMVLEGAASREAGAGSDRAKLEGGFAAHMLGQGEIKRGLKGGTPVLSAAKAAYLEAEFSGDHDRRPSPGLLRRASI